MGFASFFENTGGIHPLSKLLDGDDGDSSSHSGRKAKRISAGQEALTNENNGELWIGDIGIGTGAQTLTVQFDTGSSDLFVPGPNCRTSACQGHTAFSPDTSTTAVNGRKSFHLDYGTGSVQGNQYRDTVAFAGFTVRIFSRLHLSSSPHISVQATNQTLGVADSYSTNFNSNNFPADGLLGMGYQSISRFNAPPVFQNMFAQSQFTNPVFGFRLGDDGELTIGDVDNSSFTGNVTYTPVTQRGYWQVTLNSVNVNSTAVPSTRNVQSVIDTGTTFILASYQQVRMFYQSIPGSRSFGNGFYVFPCEATFNVSMTFGGTEFPIASDLFNLGTIDGNGNECVGAIVGSAFNFWIVGDSFLQNVYSIFDLGRNRVGFAELADD